MLLPVADVDRAKAFFVGRCGFHLDVDHSAGESFRVVQMTPPASHCSVTVGIGITDAAPGSVRGLHLVVTDIVEARQYLVDHGVEVSRIQHMTQAGWKDGVDPERADYNSFAHFSDPDGNTFLLQERRSDPPAPPAGS